MIHAAVPGRVRVQVDGLYLFCLGIGAFLGARRRRMPAWHDLIWYAFNPFELLNRPPGDAEDRPAEDAEEFTGE